MITEKELNQMLIKYNDYTKILKDYTNVYDFTFDTFLPLSKIDDKNPLKEKLINFGKKYNPKNLNNLDITEKIKKINDYYLIISNTKITKFHKYSNEEILDVLKKWQQLKSSVYDLIVLIEVCYNEFFMTAKNEINILNKRAETQKKTNNDLILLCKSTLKITSSFLDLSKMYKDLLEYALMIDIDCCIIVKYFYDLIV